MYEIHPDKSIFDLIEVADKNGMVEVLGYPMRWHATTKSLGRDWKKGVALSVLQPYRLFYEAAERRPEGWLDESGAARERQDTSNTHVVRPFVRFNLAKALLLPSLKPERELFELHAFLAGMKPFMERAVSQVPHTCFGDVPRGDVMLYNERDDKTGARMGQVSARIFQDQARTKDPIGQSLEKEYTKLFSDWVQESPVLSAFMANAERELSKHGSWDFFCIHESMLYGNSLGGPQEKALMELTRGKQPEKIARPAE